MPPKETPAEMQAIALARRRAGKYSLASAMMLGTMPPFPRPNRKRHEANPATLAARPAPAMAAQQTTVVATMEVRRPILSASGPNSSAPTKVPAEAALPITPA